MQMTEGFAKLISRICRSVNPKTVEEYVSHRWITEKLFEEEMRGGGGRKWAEIGKQMRKEMHRRDKTTPLDMSECLCALENNLWDSKGMNKTSCLFGMNTRNEQSKGHSRETGDEREKGGKVKGVLSASKWGYTVQKYSVAVLITFAVP